MNRLSLFRFLGLVAIIAAACTPAAPRANDGAQQSGQPAASAPQRTLVLAMRGEPPTLASKELVGFSGALRDLQMVFNADLDSKNERGEVYPYLAEALPQVNTDSWRVLPDGRMETTHRLKPNLTWHDGMPLTSGDFVFSWQVYATPELGHSGGLPIRSIQEIVALDPQTFTIRWKELYADAGELGAGARTTGLPPLPAHILRKDFENLNPIEFPNLPFWSTEYVGTGPYRLTRWEPGTFMEAEAFAGHALGRPKIDRLRALFIPDPNTAFASLLAGEAHYVGQFVLASDHGVTLEREWGGNQGGTVLYSPVGYRRAVAQLRPELAEPAGLVDVRVRRAVMHALDRAPASEVLHDGKGLLADTFVSSRLPFYQEVDRVIAKYPHDPRRAQQIMEEIGFTRGGDGLFVGRNGAPFELGFWSSGGAKNEQENSVIVDSVRSAGINARSHIYPPAQSRDAEIYSKTPGLLVWGGGGDLEGLENFTTDQVARPQNRWRGTNYGGWSNPAYDQLFAEYGRSLQPAERIRNLAELNRILTTDLPWIPLWYQPVVTAHVAALQGPIGRETPDAPSGIHRIQQWTWK